MNDEEELGTELARRWGKIKPAKRAAMVQRLSARLRGCHQVSSAPVEVLGMWFLFRTPTAADDAFIAEKLDLSNAMAAQRSVRAPTLACAISHIGESPDDMQPVEALFTPADDVEPIARALITDNEQGRRLWLREQVLLFLTDESSHTEFIAQLFAKYEECEKQRRAALQALRPLSKGEDSGASSPTSSPEKAS